MRSVSEQVILFALMVTLGIVLGIFFDFYRALRAIVEPGKAFTIVGDILFWIIATALVFSVLMWQTWGEMRGYVLIGLLLGFIIHWYYFSGIFLNFFKSFIMLMVWIFNIIKKITIWPIVMTKKIALPPIIYFIALSRAGTKKIKSKKEQSKVYILDKIKRLFTRPPKQD